MVFLRKKRRDFGFANRVRVAGNVGGNLDDGRCFSVKGETGTVVGSSYEKANPDGSSTPMVGVRLDGSGAVVAVPAKALRKD